MVTGQMTVEDRALHSCLPTLSLGPNLCVPHPHPSLLAWVPCRKKLYGSEASFHLAYLCQDSELISLLFCLGLLNPLTS